MNSLELLNRSWFLSLNAGPGTPAGWITFATFSAQYTLYIIPLTLLGQWFLGGRPDISAHSSPWSPSLWRWAWDLSARPSGFIPSFMVPLGHTGFTMRRTHRSPATCHAVLQCRPVAIPCRGADRWRSDSVAVTFCGMVAGVSRRAFPTGYGGSRSCFRAGLPACSLSLAFDEGETDFSL